VRSDGAHVQHTRRRCPLQHRWRWLPSLHPPADRPRGARALADERAALQPGSRLVAAAYALYSSATMVVLTLGDGAHGFTLDAARGEFVLTHARLRIPARGQIYSVNDARYFDWPAGLQRCAMQRVLPAIQLCIRPTAAPLSLHNA
jgi:hypothetical protein